MLLSLLIYGLLLIVMSVLSQKAYITRKNIYIIWAALFFALVFGLRLGVGRDHPSYLSNYLDYLRGVPDNNDEFGFSFLQEVFSGLQIHPVIFFGFIAFFEIYSFYWVLKNKKELLLPFTIVFILTAAWLPFSSGLRQALAFCFFVLALQKTDLKGLFRYFLLVFFAFSMHKSAAILIILYPFFLISKEWFKKPKIELLIYLCAVICMVTHVFESILMALDTQIVGVMTLLSYDAYLDGDAIDLLYQKEDGIGLGQLIYMALYSLLIAFSGKVKAFFKDDYFNRAYDLFFIGAVLSSLFNGSNLFGRLIWYFEYFYLFVGAFTLYYLFKKNKSWYYMLLTLMSLVFAAIIYRGDINSSYYYFYWEVDRYKSEHVGKDVKFL